MNYPGEHLFIGQLGHFFVLLSFISSLLAALAFFKSNQAVESAEKQRWWAFGRNLFAVQAASVLAIFCALFVILYNHYYEYKYAWTHSSNSLPFEYLLSCFWEGQEGSFLLWSFWQSVLGFALMRTAGDHRAGTLAVVSFAQWCISTMLLGIFIGSLKIGNNPFVLLRNEGILDDAPIFKDPETGHLRADYLQFIKDGQGLNTLLQNYWMVIHPPVLFLGFASTLVPFAFAISGLWNRSTTWVKAALPWTSFSAAALSVGIMMGAAWAYESLSFGGYWAWDPVENASMVPWLVLISGLHTHLIFLHSGYSLKATYLFYILSYGLIVYSTFLTRSGILGDTSVHAFTGADMTGQLVAFLAIVVVPALVLFFARGKSIPTIAKEENTYSREFWMFIGSLVFLLSAAIIIFQTSTPVFNKVFGTNFAKPEDVEFSYNQFQIFIAIVVGLLTAGTQYLRWKDTPKGLWLRKSWPSLALSLVLTLLLIFLGGHWYDKKGIGFTAAIYLALFSAIYGFVANGFYVFTVLKGKWRFAGASVAHMGFALMLVGILVSSALKDILSNNTTGITPLKKDGPENPAENLTLFKGVRTDMGQYWVTYQRDTLNAKYDKKHFELHFEKKADGKTFTLYPDVIKNNKGAEGFAANPDAKHYLHKDIFAYVTSFIEGNKEDTTSFAKVELKAGDTIFYSNGFYILRGVNVSETAQNKNALLPGERAIYMDIDVVSKEGALYKSRPGIGIQGNQLRPLPDSVTAQRLQFRFEKIADEKKGTLELGVRESAATTDLLTLKVLEFPAINLLWLGVIVMAIGFVMSMWQRWKKGGRGQSIA